MIVITLRVQCRLRFRFRFRLRRRDAVVHTPDCASASPVCVQCRLRLRLRLRHCLRLRRHCTHTRRHFNFFRITGTEVVKTICVLHNFLIDELPNSKCPSKFISVRLSDENKGARRQYVPFLFQQDNISSIEAKLVQN